MSYETVSLPMEILKKRIFFSLYGFCVSSVTWLLSNVLQQLILPVNKDGYLPTSPHVCKMNFTLENLKVKISFMS